MLKTLGYTAMALCALCLGSCEESQEELKAPGAYIKMPVEGYELEINDTLVLSPRITYEVNAKYEWFLDGELISEEKEITHISTALGKKLYTFVVSNHIGLDTLRVPVATIIRVDFKEFKLARNSYDLGINGTNHASGFYSRGLIFPVIAAPTEAAWRGFGLSNLKSNSVSDPNPSPYSAFAPVAKDSTFMLFRQAENSEMNGFYFDEGQLHRISTISVTNTSYGYLAMRNGTTGTSRFGDESTGEPNDWFLLTITGYDNNGAETGTVEFYLADYRFENKKKNYIIGDWTTVDLTSLGLVNKVEFTLTSSKTDDQGNSLTPQWFCLKSVKIVE